MKRTTALLALAVLLPTSAIAATVTIGVGSNTFDTNGQQYTEGTTTYSVYLPESLADPSENGGEELVYLGAYSAGGSGSIDVSLQSSHGGLTGPVSLVLSASESTTWIFNTADLNVVDLNNVFVVASAGTQTIQLGGQTIELATGESNSFSGEQTVDFERLFVEACGFEFGTSATDCNTSKVLGIVDEDANPLGLTNYLGDFFDNSPSYGSLEVTDFGGSHFADAFTVTFDSVAVPLPAAFWFFGSGLLGLQLIRRHR